MMEPNKYTSYIGHVLHEKNKELRLMGIYSLEVCQLRSGYLLIQTIENGTYGRGSGYVTTYLSEEDLRLGPLHFNPILDLILHDHATQLLGSMYNTKLGRYLLELQRGR